MANALNIWDHTFVADADLSAKQFYCVENTTADHMNLTNATTDAVLGPLQDKPKAGEPGAVRLLGISQVVSDGNAGAIAVGDPLSTNATGKAIKAAGAGVKCFGRAMDASTTDGAQIRVLMKGEFVLAS